jgi:hypothetical protein
MGTDRPDPIVTDVQAPLETALIDEFLRSRGYDHTSVRQLPPEQQEPLMKQASAYASGKLAEVEARAHFVQGIHGDVEDAERTRHK